MEKLREKLYEEAQEHGELHNEGCPCNMEDPDECDCENLKRVNHIIDSTIEKVVEYLTSK